MRAGTKLARELVPGDLVVERDGATLTVARVEPLPRGRVRVVCARYGILRGEITTHVRADAHVRVMVEGEEE